MEVVSRACGITERVGELSEVVTSRPSRERV
jgi:hypothetical protein